MKVTFETPAHPTTRCNGLCATTLVANRHAGLLSATRENGQGTYAATSQGGASSGSLQPVVTGMRICIPQRISSPWDTNYHRCLFLSSHFFREPGIFSLLRFWYKDAQGPASHTMSLVEDLLSRAPLGGASTVHSSDRVPSCPTAEAKDDYALKEFPDLGNQLRCVRRSATSRQTKDTGLG